MSEMVKRGAEAMRARRRELINQPLDRIWPDLMRAALEAAREPTVEMVKAGFRDDSEYANDSDTADQWHRMINAALE